MLLAFVFIFMHSSTKMAETVSFAGAHADGTEGVQAIPDGFGGRLREERKRLRLSQTEVATAGGVKRLAQGQYETGTSMPSVRYLQGVAHVGIDLRYVLFDRRGDSGLLSAAEVRRIEARAFELLEDFVSTQPEATYGAEGRFAMFQLLRAKLTEEARLISFESADG
ncbi:helix-turn-helix domain-containing protein [Paraburkholderia sp. DD10]|uniref:helix-turn-helix domain-containing protein n=1 Tax=Paraburkholderia sp. DD10 TaxID=3409691 RepID=UPI003BA34DF9